MPGERRGSKAPSLKLIIRKTSDETKILNSPVPPSIEEKDTDDNDVPAVPVNIAPPKPPRLRHNGLARFSFRSSESYDMSFKIMLLGDSGVGKTCFLIRYKDRAFLTGAYISTVGIDFRNKIVNVGKTRVKLQIWDTAGQERFRSVTQAYYRDAHAVLVIYDVSNKNTFDHAETWLSDVKKFGNETVVSMLVGNKADISSGRQVTSEEGKSLAQKHDLLFMETSAKSGMNIDQAFVEVTRVLISREEGKPKDRSFDLSQSEDDVDNNARFGCCRTG